MEAKFVQPAERQVVITMTESQALLLRKFVGQCVTGGSDDDDTPIFGSARCVPGFRGKVASPLYVTLKNLGIMLLFVLLLPAVGRAQSLNTVQTAREDLVSHGVDVTGPCGAARITNLVAWRIGFLLRPKAAGFRAQLQPDGTCEAGDNIDGPGFATDYIIDPATFFGFDILGDSGGENAPQWNGPETETAARNMRENMSPMNPAGYANGAQPTPEPTPVPPTPVPPLPSFDLTPVLDAIVTLRADVAQVQAAVNAHEQAEASRWDRANNVLREVARYALPFIGGFVGAKVF